MEAEYLKWIKDQISVGSLQKFYQSPEWRAIRAEILAEDHNECQICKANGEYEPANTVHHVKPIEEYPELALSRTYFEDGEYHRQLISVSHTCHDREHKRGLYERKPPLTPERW